MYFDFLKNAISFCDVPERWQLGIQDPATPVAEGMIMFHDYLTFFLVFIGTFVFWMLTHIIQTYNDNVSKTPVIFTHSSLLEIIWTIIPAVILVFIAVPSFTLLYSIDEVIFPKLTLKIIGHQWYWSYEYSDYIDEDASADVRKTQEIKFDSYMIPTRELPFSGALRLLEVDNRVVLPTNTHIRLLMTASDVIHSWAVPSFGIKLDACPGRLSQGALLIKRAGVFFGQCSEICGVNHGFMPIVVRSLDMAEYVEWVSLKLGAPKVALPLAEEVPAIEELPVIEKFPVMDDFPVIVEFPVLVEA